MSKVSKRRADTLDSTAEPTPPCTFVIFGATGDLTKRLLMPAFYNLSGSKLLDKDFCILGVGRKGSSDEEFQAITASSTLAGPVTIEDDADEDPSAPGRQVDIIVEVKIPQGTPSGTYTASYGAESDPEQSGAPGGPGGPGGFNAE